MKRIIAFLMATTLASSSTLMTVSCQGVRTNKIAIKFDKNQLDEFAKYDENDMSNAFNGSEVTPYRLLGQLPPFNQLAFNILNLLGFNRSQVTKPEKIEAIRKSFIGQDLETLASVDGVYFDLTGSKTDQQKFYEQFKKTHINSLEGLYDLYSFGEENKDVLKNATAANESYKVISNLFDESPDDAQAFFNSFLNLGEFSSEDSAWISQTFGLGTETNPTFHELDSLVVPYQKDIVDNDDKEKRHEKFIFDDSEKN